MIKSRINFSILPAHIKVLLQRMGIVMLFMTFSRLVFYVNNSDSFSDVLFSDFFVSVWFDIITICIFFISAVLDRVSISISPAILLHRRSCGSYACDGLAY